MNGGYRWLHFYPVLSIAQICRFWGFSMVDWLILGLEFLMLWGGHWTPWRVLPFLVDEKGQLHRPFAYGYGCGCILIGFASWAAYHTPVVRAWEAALFLCGLVVAAGLGTMAPRLAQYVIEHRALKGDVQEYEQAIARRE
jgi:hypothetical protein